ncbi:PREDICTED: E3 ubiquitin-protein ligase RNF115-like isoform X1 [Amphimedon queenslandica]|uniref:RING-type E3 ubiquitin transferase n=1 Tax=Amphimedon queenslandica TaxID=400682 RepID=A0A1X7UV39_AMPQE|nr:PREDICTED: E3 ubiquitin-protein ligase RNF115-like isoform X1 [Amphimedon queenslandica]|eukprot:XP_003386743.1 PREDICTED: E3 ubiquitin-protein ligase RNF115-like isoform X1 [Amphimedon queenslandica]
MAANEPFQKSFRFFCYTCDNQFLSDTAKCPQCEEEFVEQLEEVIEEEDERPPSPPPSPPHRGLVRPRNTQQSPHRHRHRNRSPPMEQRPRQRDQLGEMLGQYLVQLIAAREQLEDSENYTLPVIPPPPQFLELMFRSRRSEPSAPRTGVAGPGALELVITGLLEQLSNSGGPPPADETKIMQLPTSNITQEQVNGESECSICKETFVLNDEYKELPCTHIFHSHCIVAWLKLRGTCPTCRYNLNKGQRDS